MATTVESLRKAIGKRKNSRAFAWLADLMRQNGDLDLALECVRAGLSSTPCEEGNLVLSRILADKRDWDGVVEACEFVLLRNPYCLSAIRRIGDAYAEKGDVEKRNSYYRRLHDLDPLDAFWKEEYAPKIEIPESGDAETPVEAPAETVEPAEVPAAERAENPEPLVEESRNAAEEKDDDPFSSLSTLLPADEENDNEVSFNDLEHSLDDAIAGFGEAKPEKDAFPAEEIDGDDISTALSGIFGSTDAEDSFAPTVKPEAEKDASRPDAEDKPQSLSDAFDSIFGEDELPEEFVLSKPAVPSTDKPSTTAAPDASSESSAELPSEKSASDFPAEEESSPFEKSALQAQPTSESALEKSVESSFDSLFGDDSDDLPLETLTSPKTILPAESDASSESSAKLPSEKVSNDLPPAEETSPFEKSALQAQPTSESTLEKSVESSFDSLFGDDSDDLPLETLTAPKTILPAESDASSESSAELPPEKVSNDLPAAEESSPFEKSASQTPPTSESTLEKSVESSFDSLFGADSDDLPLETLTAPKTIMPAAPDASSESSAELPPETVSNDLASEEESSPFEKSAPQTKSASESTLEKSVESSFDSLFGADSDDLPLETLTSPKTILPAESDASSESSAELPPEKVSNDLPAAEESSPFEKSALQAQPTSESALEKSVESSFDSLFGENSDDALVEDPTTSTRTLAEIYFEQGVYDEAIKIYKDLLRKSPEDESLKKRLSEIENVNENRQKDN